MAKIRVHTLAKMLTMSVQDLISRLKKEGIEVKSHMSSVDEESVIGIKKTLSGEMPVIPAAQLPNLTQKKKVAEKEKEDVQDIKGKKNVYVKDKIKREGYKKERKKAKGEAEEGTSKSALRRERKKKKDDEIKQKAEGKKFLIILPEAITVKELAEKIEKKPTDIIQELIKKGIMVTVNQVIDSSLAMNIVKEFGFEAKEVRVEGEEKFEEAEETSQTLPRAPVVTIMGHVDHGKTSLLDAIRSTDVAASEAGGITQHIGAYEVELKKGKVVFLDTPGHEAFTAMRARGAQVTDLVVLVVAADDSVMPQTIEAINHAKAANVPILVAINKIDKPGANPDRVKQDLTKYNLVSEEWGGKTIVVEVSAKKKIGLETLLEMLLLEAEMLELKANPNKAARGIVIEAKVDKGRGPVATVLIQSGTLKVGDAFVCGLYYGKVRAMFNDKRKSPKEAGPSSPVEILGFTGVPKAGDIFSVVADEKKARLISETRQEKQREEEVRKTSKLSLEELYQQIQEGKIKDINIILKGDVQGSIQAVSDSLLRINNSSQEVKVKILHSSVGTITDTDVMLAVASQAIIVGFNVRPESKARELAEKEGVDIKLYTIIYEVISDVRAAMEGLLEPIYKEEVLGTIEVRETFSVSKIGIIAGCFVQEGKISRGSNIRLLRDSKVVHEGKIDSLRRFKEDVKEVLKGFECGISLEKFNDIKQGDIIEAFTLKEVKRGL
ncbi:MAG: translation initiation factor IF-2 [bacterium]